MDFRDSADILIRDNCPHRSFRTVSLIGYFLIDIEAQL